MGLLDPQALEYFGLLGQSMLAGQSPNAGVNIGNAMMYADTEMRRKAAERARLEEERQQAKMRDMAMQKALREQEAQDYMGRGIQQFMRPPQAATQQFGPGDMETPSQLTPASPGGFDQGGFAQYLAQNPATAQQALQFMPKPQAPQFKEVGGRLVAIGGDNSVKEVYAPPEKPHWIDGGDKWIPVGRDGKPVGNPIPKSMAPGEAQRIGMESQRLGMDRARLGMEAGRYNYEIGTGAGLPKKQQDAVAAAAATDRAKVQAQAQNELPQTEAEATQTIGLVDKLINHPGFSTVVGVKGPTGMPAAAGFPIPGTDAADFTVLRNQLIGKQFLQAFQTLKGGGQITEVEGKKATDAIARMDTAQSEKEFRAAAEEFKSVISSGLQRAKKKAGATSGWSIQKVN